MSDVSNIPRSSQPQRALADWVRRDYADLEAASDSKAAEKWERKTCRACGNGAPVEFLSLGEMPPANAFLRPDELQRIEPRYPLAVRLCEKCGMVQLSHVVPPQLLFRSYLFFTSSSAAMSQHFATLMRDCAKEFVPPGGLIVEIGSNDGTALSSIDRRDVRLLGVDPARNVSVMAAARGVPTVSEFFSAPLADEIARVAGNASLVVACNVLGHIDDLDDVCRGIKAMLAPHGAFIFEVPYLGELLDRLEYDTIYHEHLSYFAIRPLATLLNRHGLRLERVDFFPVHGGTLRGTAIHGDGASLAVQQLIAQENQRGINRADHMINIATKISDLRTQLKEHLTDLKNRGLRVIGYGAPAKGTVVLNYCNIGPDLVPIVLDSTPAKQGLHVPGTHQQILPPTELHNQRPDVLLLLAWNHAQEILEREKTFRKNGGKFLTPHLAEL
jgi:novobiocin biosynthesis protein NovU/D-mycarose 3-C-methyltransferase